MIAGTEAEYQSDAESTKDTTYNPYGVSFVNIYEKIDQVITALYCIEIVPCLFEVWGISVVAANINPLQAACIVVNTQVQRASMIAPGPVK